MYFFNVSVYICVHCLVKLYSSARARKKCHRIMSCSKAPGRNHHLSAGRGWINGNSEKNGFGPRKIKLGISTVRIDVFECI